MMFENFDFRPGKAIYNDFDIDPKLSFEEQLWSYKEDMLQVSFHNSKYVLDIGWSPDFEINGFFKVQIIKELDWMAPIYSKKTNNLDELHKLLEECVQEIKKLLRHS